MLYVKLKPSAHIPNGIRVQGAEHPILKAARQIKERELSLTPKKIGLSGYSREGIKGNGSLEFESRTGLLYRATTVGAFALGLYAHEDRLFFTSPSNSESINGEGNAAIIACESAAHCVVRYYGADWGKHHTRAKSYEHSLMHKGMKAERRYVLVGIDPAGRKLLRGLDGGEVVIVGGVPIEHVFVVGKRMIRQIIRFEGREDIMDAAEIDLSSDLRRDVRDAERYDGLQGGLTSICYEVEPAEKRISHLEIRSGAGGSNDAIANYRRLSGILGLAVSLKEQLSGFFPFGAGRMPDGFFAKASSDIEGWLAEIRNIAAGR